MQSFFWVCLFLGSTWFASGRFLHMKRVSGGKERSLSRSYTPKSENQRTYVADLKSPSKDIVVGVGPAGTGKTLFACHVAVEALRSGRVSKIIITRPVVSVEEDIGFLPGNLVMKMDPWTKPIFDILLEVYTQKDIDAMIHGGVIEIAPLAFMRGRTFKRAFLIADEMQNSSPNQMLMLLTRLGEGSKMVLNGDLNQSDRSEDNGLRDLLQKLKGSSVEGMGYTEFELEDVERHPMVRRILTLYETPPHQEKKTPPRRVRKPKVQEADRTIFEDAAIIPRDSIPERVQDTEGFATAKWIGW